MDKDLFKDLSEEILISAVITINRLRNNIISKFRTCRKCISSTYENIDNFFYLQNDNNINNNLLLRRFITWELIKINEP